MNTYYIPAGNEKDLEDHDFLNQLLRPKMIVQIENTQYQPEASNLVYT